MKKLGMILLTTLFLFLLIGCSDSEIPTQDADDVLDTTTQTTEPDYSDKDLDDDITSYDSTLTFNTTEITTDDSSITIDEMTVTISEAGTYLLTGTAEASIIVDAGADDDVIFVFNGLHLSNDDNAIITVLNADKLLINVKEDTTNTLTDLSDSEYEDDAVIYSKDDVTINGTGSLTITAGLQKGIKVNDDFTIVNTTLTIETDAIGIDVHDSAQFKDATINITSGADGIQDNNEDDITQSVLTIDGGSYTIIADGDAIDSAYQITMFSGTLDLTTTGLSGDSSKGLKADDTTVIFDGSIMIDSDDDSIHTVDLLIDNGTFTLTSNDDAIHADGILVIEDGDIHILDAYEGIEGMQITISGGTFSITVEDDGINASDPDVAPLEGPFQSTENSNASLVITGGTFYIESEDDSIDANGAVVISGGLIVIDGPTSGTQSAVDYDTTWKLTGGTIIAVVGYGNETKVPTDASQIIFMYNTQSTHQAGTTVSL